MKYFLICLFSIFGLLFSPLSVYASELEATPSEEIVETIESDINTDIDITDIVEEETSETDEEVQEAPIVNVIIPDENFDYESVSENNNIIMYSVPAETDNSEIVSVLTDINDNITEFKTLFTSFLDSIPVNQVQTYIIIFLIGVIVLCLFMKH